MSRGWDDSLWLETAVAVLAIATIVVVAAIKGSR